jgi:hypothetical protein
VSDLEQIVRPSQAYSFRPPPNYAARAPVITKGSKVVTWGSSGQNIFQLQASIQQNVPPATWPKEDEEKRTYDVVRVFNADDPTTFVDTEVMTEYQSRNQLDGSRTTLRFATNTDTATTQVISRGNVRVSSP